jgi:RimJ/RimL family protein N-acetyltransferase
MPGPAYRIITPRLVIRCYNPADAPLLENSVTESLNHLLPWMPWAAVEPEPLDAKIERLRNFRARFDLGQDFTYGIFTPTQDRLIGGAGLHTRIGPDALEIGYWLHKDFTNQGYATETAAALTRVGFEIHKVGRIEIHCAGTNLRSAAVPRKLGYTLDATLQKRGFHNGQPTSGLLWSLFIEDYPKSPAIAFECAAYDAAERRI